MVAIEIVDEQPHRSCERSDEGQRSLMLSEPVLGLAQQ
jgi:hypothetical protein